MHIFSHRRLHGLNRKARRLVVVGGRSFECYWMLLLPSPTLRVCCKGDDLTLLETSDETIQCTSMAVSDGLWYHTIGTLINEEYTLC